MKFVIQRVLNSQTTIIETGASGEKKEYVSGKIGHGYMVLCGIMDTDTVEIADKMVAKLIGLRIFEDENGKTNLDLKTVGGELMIVSQFTLCADTSHGNRPAFIKAARPEKAIPIYEHIIEECRNAGFNVQTGVFGADMKVDLTNDGPFTIILDSDDLVKSDKKTPSSVKLESKNNNPGADLSIETASDVLNTCVKLRGAEDFEQSVTEVMEDICDITDARHVCLLLVDQTNRKCSMVAQAYADHAKRVSMNHWEDDEHYALVETWTDIIAEKNCLIAVSEEDLLPIKEKNPGWYESLHKAQVDSIVLFPLKAGKELIGYIWATNFDIKNTKRITETLDLTTFFLASEIKSYKMMKHLKRMSTVDELTGCLNRNAMNIRIDSILADTDKEKHSLGVVFADLNGLKRVNDSKGHEAGDLLLKTASIALMNSFNGDEVYRAGGDEFMVLIDDAKEEEIIYKVSQLRSIASMYGNVSFAIGYHYCDDRKDVLEALHEADELMYSDKKQFYANHPELDIRKKY